MKLHRRNSFVANQRLSTIGLVMPKDFDVTRYEAIHFRAVARKEVHPDSYSQLSGAWNAVAYRFLSCMDHDLVFTESIQRAGDAPPQPERYIQERELFCFFVTGLAVIESFCYGLFALASMVDSKKFRIATSEDLRSITPKKTAGQFADAFPKESITVALKKTITHDVVYREWGKIRNILAHRAALGRIIHLSTKSSPRAALWETGIQLDENTTSSRRKWLAKTVSTMLRETDSFTANNLP